MIWKSWLVCLLVCLLGQLGWGANIKVAPGAFCVKNIEVGEDIDLGLDLVISNDGPMEQSFRVSALKPSQARKSWIKGYGEIPDPSWFYFKSDRIKVAPYREGRMRMHLRIPEGEQYHNQRWMVYLNVANELKEGEMLGLSIKPNYMIETVSQAEPKARPHGRLGVAPSVLRVERLAAGRKRSASFRLYNNEDEKRVYSIYTYIPKAGAEKQDISGTNGYDWIRSAGWVKPLRSRVTVGPRQTARIELAALVPAGYEAPGEGWEAIVMVEPDQGLANFVRLLIDRNTNEKGGES